MNLALKTSPSQVRILTLGLDKQAPDEFSVVARAPLELPPDYSLRPPRAGTLRPQDLTPTETARTSNPSRSRSDAAIRARAPDSQIVTTGFDASSAPSPTFRSSR